MVALQHPPQTRLIQAGDRRARAALVRVALIAGLAVAILLGLGWGAAEDTDVIGALMTGLGYGDASLRDMTIVWDIRMPRVLTATLVGAALAVSGAVMQGLFRNPLADPGLVGVSAGAGFGAVAAIVLGGFLPTAIAAFTSIYLVPFAAFLGSWVSTLILYRIATRGGQTSVATMLLAGIAMGALTGALTGLIVYKADDSQLRDLTFWGMGSVAGATWQKVMFAGPIIALTLFTAPFLARSLDALALGEAVAHHMGINTQKMKRVAIISVAASVGTSVAITGGIGFVGIVVPHLLRLLQGPEHRNLLPNAALLGAVVVLLADMVSRVIVAPAELPIGIVTACLGGPFFLWILLKNRTLLEA
jgi:iron complex transport system permease protein